MKKQFSESMAEIREIRQAIDDVQVRQAKLSSEKTDEWFQGKADDFIVDKEYLSELPFDKDGYRPFSVEQVAEISLFAMEASTFWKAHQNINEDHVKAE